MNSFEPDTVDIVRIPSIRGQLRWWWRSLYQDWQEDSSGAVADRIFAEEARLWGGVGLPGEGGADAPESPGRRSRVGLSVKVLSPGEVVPAGVHELGNDGRPKALPRWTIGRRLGYALFPLQIRQNERQGNRALQTRSCRTELRFRLNLTVPGTAPGMGPDAAEIVQVLASLWAWIFFGGIGARTRRGFGTLEPAEAPVLESFTGFDDTVWKRLFQAPAENKLFDWLKDFERAAAPRGRVWPPQVLTGGLCRSPQDAHGEVVDRLRCFRQERGTGREPGGDRPGRSYWPEPNLLRTLAPPGGPFTHEPPADMARQVEEGEVGAPRAAFGLPIQVQFKDHGDQRANATLQPPGAGRWPSPLLLRPLRSASGRYWPVVVILPFRPPAQVEVKYGEHHKPIVPVARSAGSRDPIARLLSSNGGNALQAFTAWLKGNGYA